MNVFVDAVETRMSDASSLLGLTAFGASTAEGRSRERHRRAVVTGVASVAAKLVTVTTALISVPLTLNYLGAERFGMWMVISSLITLLSFADLGIGNGVVNRVAAAYGDDDDKQIQRIVSSGFLALSAIAACCLIVFALLYPLIPWARVLNVHTVEAAAEAGPAVAVFVACFVLGIPAGIVQRVQFGLQRGFLASIWACAGALLGLGATVLAIHLNAGLPWLVASMAGAPVAAAVANGWIFFRRHSLSISPRRGQAQFHTAKAIAATGLLFFLIQLFGAILYASDNLVIAQLLGAAAVTDYAVPEKMFSVSMSVVTLFLAPLWPAYAEAIARRDVSWVGKTLGRSLLVSSVVSASLAFTLLLFGNQLLNLWLGKPVHADYLLLAGLAVWKTTETVGQSVAALLNGANALRTQVTLAALMMPVAIAVKISLVSAWGVAGAPWATWAAFILCVAIPCCVLVPRLLRSMQRDP